MFIRSSKNGRRGWSLVEMMIAVGVFGIASAALGTLFVFSTRSLAAMANYAALDQQNRIAMDTLTREIRQAKQVTSVSTNPPSITIENGDGDDVTYTFSASSKTMIRQVNGVSQVLLTNCSLLQFHLFQRTPSNGNYFFFPPATNNWQNSVKLIELTWKTSKALNPTAQINSENVQTARIVIRKQKDD